MKCKVKLIELWKLWTMVSLHKWFTQVFHFNIFFLNIPSAIVFFGVATNNMSENRVQLTRFLTERVCARRLHLASVSLNEL